MRTPGHSVWRRHFPGMPNYRVVPSSSVIAHRAHEIAPPKPHHSDERRGIEAVTYRMAAHSTADDASRYQPPEEIAPWRDADPIERFRAWLASNDAADPAFLEAVDGEAHALAARTREGVLAMEPRPVEELFAWVYADLPPDLARQRDAVLRDA